MIKWPYWFPALLGLWVMCLPAFAQQERDAAEAEAAATADDREGKAYEVQRPANLPDWTKGHGSPGGKAAPVTWNMGPTGIIGLKNGGFAGDQVQVVALLPGSPAEGTVLPGDVILGVQGKDFVAGGHLGVTIGNAIIKAEEEEGQGLLQLHVWRDRNWSRRAAGMNVAGVDVDALFKQAEGGADVYEWMGEAERRAAVAKAMSSDFPVDGFHTNLTLRLKVMGTYSDTSPWDCPVVARVREDAWKAIEATFRPDKQGRTAAGWRDVLALVASGKPEHRALVRDWVRKQKLCQDLNATVTLPEGGGMLSWHRGFAPLEMAVYYDATGDDYVLPELRYRAIETAMGQSGGGSWGHTFSFTSFNGGQMHGRCPGYGGMNNAGSRCFFLLALARKAGIEHPEIDAAIGRASRFFSTYVDKGCIPYGDHAPYPSDDSNGKNYGVAYAFYLLGKPYEAKYFAMHSCHAAFTPRGGHGSPVLWQYTPLSSHIAGPRGVAAAMRNMRWFYTMARRHDGSFTIQSEQEGVGAYGYTGASPTAMYALYHSLPLGQLVITGKDANTNCWFDDEELDELLVSARSQLNDPVLLERSGKPWQERGTAELIVLLDHFYPKMRRAVAAELGRRFQAGEADIAARATELLDSAEPRQRDGACITLVACGADCARSARAKLAKLLEDPAEFVRMNAVAAMAAAYAPGDRALEELLLKAARTEYPGMSTDLANVRTAVRDVLFRSGKNNGEAAAASLLTTEPFAAGYDRGLVRDALERLVTMDPGGKVMEGWSRGTVVELAGPIVFVADEMQLMDTMFGLSRTLGGRALLTRYGYREAVESDVATLLKRSRLDRRLRSSVTFVHRRFMAYYGYVTPDAVALHPGGYAPFLPHLRQWLQDDPLATAGEMELDALIGKIESAGDARPMPSLAAEVAAAFGRELAGVEGGAERARLCREVLHDPQRRTFFRQMAALSQLADMLGPESVEDIVPYLASEQWRVREHAHAVAVKLAKAGAAAKLAALFPDAGGETAAAVLTVLAESGARQAFALIPEALRHPHPGVRQAALRAAVALEGEQAIPKVLAFMAQTAITEDLSGCELALLGRPGDTAFGARVRAEALDRLPQANPPQRRSLAWVLAQLGGTESLSALGRVAAKTADDEELDAIVLALSYAPDRAADKTLLELAGVDRTRRDAVARQAVRRMVGPNGTRDVTDVQRLDFAVPLLQLTREPRLIAYLGNVHTGRSVQVLFELMKSGSAALAAPAIINAAEGMAQAPEEERAMAADALTGVIEYIEVTKLRGGPSAHMDKNDDYAGWKALQTRAGQTLLKVHKPGSRPVPQFRDTELDL